MNKRNDLIIIRRPLDIPITKIILVYLQDSERFYFFRQDKFDTQSNEHNK